MNLAEYEKVRIREALHLLLGEQGVDFRDAVCGYVCSLTTAQFVESLNLVDVSPTPLYESFLAIEKYRKRYKKDQRPANDGKDCLKRAYIIVKAYLYHGCPFGEAKHLLVQTHIDWRNV